ncbi:MAG: protein kinase [Candidatus Promineifilaceae bacterium]|nr:protein kinase [Candidatus Promineifilaceae bacterium]
MIGTTLGERYRLDRVLGQGGMGTVYQAHDTLLSRDVAVKLLSSSRLGEEGRNRLLREARIVARLDHSNIVTVFDVGEHEGDPFIVMQLLDGGTLHDQRPEELTGIIQIVRQICAALEYAHQHGIVHRDLKPENIAVGADGTVRLMDFGLAHSAASRITQEGAVMGTVHYMAPEQIQGKEVDPRADLYALGVMVYELTTGELPFDADSPVAVLTQHLNAPVVPPRAKRENLPPSLDQLIVSLLAKQPEDRPPSAAAVLARLDDPDLLAAEEKSGQELHALERIVRGRFVAREAELKLATSLWQQATHGDGQLVLISGEPGVGKSRLAAEILAQAEVTGARAYTGEYRPEGNMPYSAFAQIVGQVLRQRTNDGRAFPPSVLADLLKLSPELAARFPDVEPNPELDPEAERRRLFEHMVSFCQIMSQERPLLLLLEDLHWADSGSLSMLQLLARRTVAMPIMLLGTYREVELDVSLPFYQAVQQLERRNLAKRIKLERLSRDQTGRLLATIFSEAITPEFLNGIYQETEGNPFFIEEVCKALIESGQLRYQEGHWDRPSMEELRIPQGIKVAVQTRVNRLSEVTQSLLLFAAVIGRVFDYTTLERVAGQDEDTLIDSLEDALRAQLIEEVAASRGQLFRFAHALIPYSLREGVSGLRRSRLHRQVAAAIEETAPEDFERLAHHWGEAGNEEKGLDYTVKAARRARSSFANEEALRLYTEALSLLPGDHWLRYELLAERAQIYGLVGNYEAQRRDAETMLTIAEKQDDESKIMDALLELAAYKKATNIQQVEVYAERVKEMAERVGDKGRLGRAYAMLGQASQRSLGRAGSSRARAYIEKAAKLLNEAGLVKEAAANLSSLSFNLSSSDRPAALQVAEEALAASQRSEDRLLEATAYRRLGIALGSNFRYEEAMQALQKALALAREVGDRSAELHTLNTTAIGHVIVGNHEEAEQGYLDALGIASEIGEEAGRAFAVNNLINLYNRQGDYEKGLRLAEKQTERARQEDIRSALFQDRILFRRQHQLYLLGQYQRALELLLTFIANVEAYQELNFKIKNLAYLSELHLRLGHEVKGRQAFERAQRLLADNGLESIQLLQIWSQFLEVALLQPDTVPLSHILAQLTTLSDNFRESRNLDTLQDALYAAARLHLAFAEEEPGHLDQALEALQEAETAGQTIRPDDTLRERILWLNARAHRLAGHEQQADDYLKQAHDWLLACAERITTPAYRRSYLNQVPDNVFIRQAYQARFGSDA